MVLNHTEKYYVFGCVLFWGVPGAQRLLLEVTPGSEFRDHTIGEMQGTIWYAVELNLSQLLTRQAL